MQKSFLPLADNSRRQPAARNNSRHLHGGLIDNDNFVSTYYFVKGYLLLHYVLAT